VQDWFTATEARDAIGEINVPAMSLLQALVMGNGLSRIVQLGHFYGYSALLLGLWLRQMGGERVLFSIDIDTEATRFCEEWIRRAGLQAQVRFHTADSAAPASRDAAARALGGRPQLVLVDSSHQYEHTLRELNLWIDELPTAGLMLLHDVSVYAQSFDGTGRGGVRTALSEWVASREDVDLISINGDLPEGVDANRIVYLDGCGIGILQKRGAPGAQVG
jgi:predicted O-methyltransferase YrrM